MWRLWVTLAALGVITSVCVPGWDAPPYVVFPLVLAAALCIPAAVLVHRVSVGDAALICVHGRRRRWRYGPGYTLLVPGEYIAARIDLRECCLPLFGDWLPTSDGEAVLLGLNATYRVDPGAMSDECAAEYAAGGADAARQWKAHMLRASRDILLDLAAETTSQWLLSARGHTWLRRGFALRLNDRLQGRGVNVLRVELEELSPRTAGQPGPAWSLKRPAPRLLPPADHQAA